MKIDLYIDLSRDNIEYNIGGIKNGYIPVVIKPLPLGDNQDRLKIVVELPDKYFKHKSDDYGVVQSVNLVDINTKDIEDDHY